MLYIRGTIDRKDGKRMTQKRANAVFDAFLEWLDDAQGCAFGGGFNPTFNDGDAGDVVGLVAPRTVTFKEAGWYFPKTKTKRKTKR